uniref:Innexin n=1 Tax=Panagrellus redivivus TaxID=6233 RepID=A0A7E4URR3_PANRE
MFGIPSVFGGFKKLNSDPLDDPSDRLSSAVSVALLVSFCALASGRIYVGDPIECLVDRSATSSWSRYYMQYCFVQPHLYLRSGTGLTAEATFSRPQVAFYPWIPYAMFLQACIFYLPKLLWDFFNCRLGIDLKSVLEEAKQLADKPIADRRDQVRELAAYMTAALDFVFDGHRVSWFLLSSPTAVCYILKKWLYVVLALAQFRWLIGFIGSGNLGWGFSAAMAYSNYGFHQASTVLPITTTCRIPTTIDGDARSTALPCILGMNVVFERLYIVLYFWLIAIIAISLTSAIRATMLFVFPAFRFTAINARLKLSRHSYLGQQNVISFLHSVLRADGLLAVSLIQESYGTALAEQLLRELWVMSESGRVRPRQPKLYDSLPTDLKLPSFSQSPNDLPKVPLMTSFTYDTPLKPHFK